MGSGGGHQDCKHIYQGTLVEWVRVRAFNSLSGVHLQLCVCVCLCTSFGVCVCASLCLYVCKSVRACMCVCVCALVCVCVCIKSHKPLILSRSSRAVGGHTRTLTGFVMSWIRPLFNQMFAVTGYAYVCVCLLIYLAA